jgi:hypothetical protein
MASQNGWTWSADVRETWNVQPLAVADSSVSPDHTGNGVFVQERDPPGR